jgi:hypothetical protein
MQKTYQKKGQEKRKEQLISELTQNNKDLKQFSYIIHNLRQSQLTGLLSLTDDIIMEDIELAEILDGFKINNLLNETINDLTSYDYKRPSVQRND